jgi:hypothetical protein
MIGRIMISLLRVAIARPGRTHDVHRSIHKVFLHRATGVLYWNAASPHFSLRSEFGYTPKIAKWVATIAATAGAQNVLATDVVKCPFRSTTGFIESHLIGTRSFVAWLMSVEITNQSGQRLKHAAFTWMAAICEKALIAHTRLSHATAILGVQGDTHLMVTTSGDVHGWEGMVAQCNGMVRAEWGNLASQSEPSTSRLHAILRFALASTVFPNADDQSRSLMRLVVYALADFVYSRFDDWTVKVYAHAERTDAPPILYRAASRPTNTVDPGEQSLIRSGSHRHVYTVR